jgi:hypothetical protein
LKRLRTPEDVALARGLTVAQVLPIPKAKAEEAPAVPEVAAPVEAEEAEAPA